MRRARSPTCRSWAAGKLRCTPPALTGDRFGILAFNRPLFPLWEEQVRGHGLASRGVPLVEIPADYGAVVDGFRQPEPLVQAFERAAQQSPDLGADVIIPVMTAARGEPGPRHARSPGASIGGMCSDRLREGTPKRFALSFLGG